MINKTVVLDGDCQLIIPQDGELGVVTAIRKPYPPYTGETIVTPSDSIQVLPTELTTLTDNIIVNPVPGDYVGSDIPRRDGDDMTASGATVTAPAGYYEESASKAVPSGTEGTPIATKGAVSNHAVTVTPTVTNSEGYISGGTRTGSAVTVTASELESGTKSITANGTGIDVTGYAEVDVAVPSSSPTLQTVTKTYTPTESRQTETITPGSGYDGIGEVDVTVEAVSSSYVGSGVARKSSSDLTASGATVNVPAGYYESAASKAVASGTEGTPTATKGTVSNHSVSVTPSVVNAEGYINGGTKTGTPVTVSASELVSGSQTVSENGVVDVTNLESITVDVGEAELGEKTVTANGVYNASADNLDGYSKVTVTVPASAVDSGTKSISTNGTHDVIGYASASVAVPASEVDSGTKSITQNGTGQDVVGYAAVDVNVPNSYTQADEGKVVSSGALVSQTSASYSANGTYDTTLINEVEVAVAPVNIQPLSVSENGVYNAPSGVDGYSPVTVNVQGGISADDIAGKTLSGVVMGNASIIAASAFAGYNQLTGVSFPNCTSIYVSAFYGCSNLETASFPNCTATSSATFQNCSKLKTAYFPKLQSPGNNAFRECAKLTDVNIQSCISFPQNAFSGCKSLSIISLPNITNMGNSTFYNCNNLIELHLEGVPSVPSLANNNNVFYSTPIAGYSASAGRYGSVFVPASLYSAFQTATGWSSIANRMVSV